MIDPALAQQILSAVRHYHLNLRSHCSLFLLMPDHAHALLAFPPHLKMNRAVGDWKHFARSSLRIDWQNNFFDHRIRNQAELYNKYLYILRNPVAKGLCKENEDWPWKWKPDA